jgi:signal transduction histidine kinase
MEARLMDEGTGEKLPHILVVDDEAQIRQMMTLCLEKFGYRVSSAQSAAEAYALVAGHEFDTIVTDVMMPGEDGIQFLANVHLHNPHIPVIIMTGYAQLQIAINAVKNGAFDFIHKPFDTDYLNKTIDKAVEYARLVRLEKDYRKELEKTVALRTEELKQALEQLDSAKSALLKAADDKSTFLSTITHEMRTPMYGVVGALDLLADEKCTGTQREYLEMARQSAETMLNLIDQVLSFRDGVGCGTTADYGCVDMNETVGAIVEEFQPLFAEKGLALNVQVAPDVPQRVRSNNEQLTRLLDILLGNALKFTESGGARLEVSTERDEGGRELIRFDVSDSGIGIPSDMLDRIFEPFVQADDSLTRRFGGAGLGLSIARQIALLLNGRIWLESTPGAGSCFHLSMPIYAP